MFSILFYSCQSDDSNIIVDEQEDFNTITADLEVQSDNYVMNLFDSDFIEHRFDEYSGMETKTIKKNTKINGRSNDVQINNIMNVSYADPQIVGPFTKEFSHTGTLTNQKIIWQGGEGFATGMYSADIHIYTAEVQLPQNSVGIVNSATNYGYTNYSNQNLGYNTGSSSSNGNNLFIVTTYFIELKYNALGQSMGSFLYPSATAYSNPKEITYSYITI